MTILSQGGLAEVFAYVDERRQAFLDRLLDYLRRPSISAHGLGMAEVADALVALLGGLGMDARLAVSYTHLTLPTIYSV